MIVIRIYNTRTISVYSASEDENEEIITENSGVEAVEAVVNEKRPETPELCLTGVAMTQDTGCDKIYYQNSQIRLFKTSSVRKIQTKAILEELSSSNKIAETVQSPSGAVAYT